MYQNIRQAGANSSSRPRCPPGCRSAWARAWWPTRSFTQGNLQQSSNPLDIAMQGNGFFEVQMPDGTTGYTRDGSFQLNAQGQVVTNNGYLLNRASPIPANAQSVTIGNDGTVSVTLPGNAQPQTLGQIALASFINPAGLEARGPEPVRRDRPPRARRTGAPGTNGAGHAAPGFRRDQQRQRRRGADRHDPDAARLRAEFEGDPDLRPDAAEAGTTLMHSLFPRRLSRRPPALLAPAARRSTRRPRSTWPSPRSALPVAQPAPMVNNGAIFQAAQYRPLFEDHRARLVGDTLTVQIVEKVSATQKSTSSIDKQRRLSAGITALPLFVELVRARQCRGSSSNTLDGKGSTENSNDFSAPSPPR